MGYLNDYVIGRDQAKRLAVAVCNHYKRILVAKRPISMKDEVELARQHPPPRAHRHRKTLLAQTLARCWMFLAMADATT